MNILLLSAGYRNKDEMTRVDYIKKIAKYHNFNMYGPDEYELDKILAPVPYNEDMIAKDIVQEFKPDIILTYMYQPHCGDWIPKDISKVGVCTVVIEQDHYYTTDEDQTVLNWYKELDFTLLMQRHYYAEDSVIPSVWTPPSANERLFSKSEEQEDIIGFAGSFSAVAEHYGIRRQAITQLIEADLLAKDSGNIWDKDDYSKFLRGNIGNLSCSGGTLHTPLQKTFEIMLSRSALLCNHINGIKELFGDNQCYFEYSDDCSDVIDVAKSIINDKEYTKEVVQRAYDISRIKHTDSARISQLNDIFEALVSGKEIPKIWGR